MKYFTPELFVQANSEDDGLAEKALHEWETASAAYLKYIAGIKVKLPKAVRAFMQSCNLHDAHLLPARDSIRFAPFWILSGVDKRGVVLDTSLSFRQDNHDLTLEYKRLLKKPDIARPVESRIFREGNTICLYDEFTLGRDGRLSHELLFSNGYVTKIRFRDFAFIQRQIVEAPQVEPLEFPSQSATG